MEVGSVERGMNFDFRVKPPCSPKVRAERREELRYFRGRVGQVRQQREVTGPWKESPPARDVQYRSGNAVVTKSHLEGE
jgi:hypothetical protein